VKRLAWAEPLRWLRLGLRDFTGAPGIGLFYGACFMGMGWALIAVFRQAPAYTLALSAGFLLAGPFLCLGLYQTSRTLERGEAAQWLPSLFAWRQRGGALALFGMVLLVLEMLWGRASLIVFALSFDGMPDFKGSVLALLEPENLGFIGAYLAVGSVFAGLIFATSVISIPMILDSDKDAISAGVASLQLVVAQPLVMAFWGALITVLVVLAMLPAFLGLLVVGPIIGHASWHAYRSSQAPA
jgi:uncharacterized membrane protein